MNRRNRRWVVRSIGILLTWTTSVCFGAQQNGASVVDYNRTIRPILSENCWKCHGPDEAARKADLRLDLRESALKGGESGRPAFHPAKPDQSEVVKRLTTKDPALLMPPPKEGKQLSAKELEALKQWISDGAPYDVHWAYRKPVRPDVPETRTKTWARNDFDQFVLLRLEQSGLEPSPEADRYTLARRVALDLTGLPPTLEEAEAFVQNTSNRAYEDYVDRLLESPAFGEHWARVWLDLARYADSAGYADDPARTIWPFRDYVIRAFNSNLSFDRFTLEQIAGDLLDEPTEETRTATAFHRNTMTNSEGGTDDEEFRNAAVVDRVNTTMTVWMGTSMACAQCHTHKYDPLTHKEYFRMFALFNNTEDADRPDETPVLDLSPAPEKALRESLSAELKALEKAAKDQASKPDSNRISEIKLQLSKLKPVTVPVMRELASDKQRETRVHLRGNFKSLGDRVTPGVPAIFHPLPTNAPANRLALARWLVDENNPLTARVLANRFYEQIFGFGLVRTSEEFGSQGDVPAHPELLDWLATELVRLRWDQKKFLRLLVTSAAYRQSSAVAPALLERDPENMLLSRGPRFRMSAEVVRDQSLFVSGLLSRKMFGPPLRPPQPSLGLSAAFGSTLDWKSSEGEDRYRRALYTEWRRTNPYASLATFDAPSRETCVVRRPRSNTPLQALVTMNDPVYVEAAQALASRAFELGSEPADKVRIMFRLCLIRPPTPSEASRILKFYEDCLHRLKANPDRVASLLKDAPLRPGTTSPAAPSPELASWTVVASSLLNLDEMLMRP